MGALAKLLSYPHTIVAAFFLRVLPQLLKLLILAICMLYKYYKFMTINYKYTSTINNKSSKFCHTKNRRPNLDDECCSVCLSEIEQGEEGMELDDCKHAFHKNCLEKWLKGYRATCPLCRSMVVPEVIVQEYQKMQSDEEGGDHWIEKEMAIVLLNALMDARRNCCNGFFRF